MIDCPVCASGDVEHKRAEALDLPPRIVVDSRGFYWRDYGAHYSMCPVTEDNEPVKPAAVYVPDDIRAANPPQTREAEGAAHRYVPDAMAMGDCRTCGRVFEDHAARTPEAQRDAPVDDWTCDWKPDDLNPGPECPYCSGAMCARIDSLNCRHDRIERHGYPAGQRDARNRAQIDVERLTAALRPGHLFEHDGGTEDCEARDPVAAREMAEEIVEAYAAATQPPAAGTEGGE